jgi:prepilin-type N-terminal cleavage/methylation domain-containing protein
MSKDEARQRGFTFIELLVTGVVLGALCVASLPLVRAKSFKVEQVTAQRWMGVAELAQGVRNYVRDNGHLPEGLTNNPQEIGSDSDMYDLCLVLVPHYLTNIPFDPFGEQSTSNCLDENTSYDSGFTIATKGTDKIVVAAPLAPKETPVSITVRWH